MPSTAPLSSDEVALDSSENATASLNKLQEDEKIHDNDDAANIDLDKISPLAGWDQIQESTPSPQPQHEEVKFNSTDELTRITSSLITDSNLKKISLADSSLPPWPSTPPTPKSPKRPLFLPSSSSDSLNPPTVDSTVDVVNDNMGPASRAVAAAALSASPNQHMIGPEIDLIGSKSDNSSSHTDYSRQETLHSSNQSGLNELADKESNMHDASSPVRSNLSSPPRIFSSSSAFPHVITEATKADAPNLYTFTPNSYSGKILTYLSQKFVPSHRRHTHGGSALAGFLALLLVTCANYMLGPMRDAAALAVGVSHIPALTLASTVLALGSSVPVGWLFEAPDPRRRRVWKRMGLTRGETQGTSLALFYRVFAFLLLSYAIGFQLVEWKGDKTAMGGDDDTKGEESAIALIGSIFIRLLAKIGIPVDRLLSSLEQIAGDVFGVQDLFSSSELNHFLDSYREDSIPTLFMYAFTCIVTKFGKVIYIMFFLVVHLMKLHSLSLIWGVTTEAMEYEENAEQRRAAQEKEAMTRTTSAGGLVITGRRNSLSSSMTRMNSLTSLSENKCSSNDAQTPPQEEGPKPSKNMIRLKRLGFVGFGGTLGGILGR